MSDVVIRAEGLGKKYLIGHQASSERYTALRDVLVRNAKGLGRSARDMILGRQIVVGDEIEEFWALKDVNFEIRHGDVVGVIGRNGAGKSTLLKILSRITEPSVGRVEIKGRVASLLEVGTGFHPELSGRENIYLNGAILGMSHAEISRKFDAIVEFAEVERFLDTPVKRYSSGMYVKLAFSVAAFLQQEILVVDEVLAVGDMQFQKKCLQKMEDVSKGGRTILFVSHNFSAIRRLCETSILLNQGSVRLQGDTAECISEFFKYNFEHKSNIVDLRCSSRRVASDPRVSLVAAECLTAEIRQGDEIRIRITFDIHSPINDVVLGVGFSGLDGGRYLSTDSDLNGGTGFNFKEQGRHSVDLVIPALPLSSSHYLIDIGCRTSSGQMLDNVEGSMALTVAPSKSTPSVYANGYRTALVNGNWALTREHE